MFISRKGEVPHASKRQTGIYILLQSSNRDILCKEKPTTFNINFDCEIKVGHQSLVKQILSYIILHQYGATLNTFTTHFTDQSHLKAFYYSV